MRLKLHPFNSIEMTKVTAKQTLAGEYGQKAAGDTFEVKDRLAKELSDKGLVEITGDADGQDDNAVHSKEEADKADSAKGSVNITDNTNREKKVITTSTSKEAKK